VFVSLLPQAGYGPARVAVFIDEQQVGFLPAGKAARYQPAMAAACGQDLVLMVGAVIETRPEGRRQLRAYPAGVL